MAQVRPTITEINQGLQEKFSIGFDADFLYSSQNLLETVLESEDYETVEDAIEALVDILYKDLANARTFLQILGEEVN